MAEQAHPDRGRRHLRKVVSTAGLLAVLAGGAFAWNQSTLQGPLQEVLDADERNAGVDVRVHYKHYMNPGVIVYDLRGVDAGKSPLDVFRVFLQFAEAMKEESFERVELSFRGETKFVLDGPGFHELGGSYEAENPMFLVRTFPERLQTPAGARAYGVHEGGGLMVLGAQMDDFNDFHQSWWSEAL